MSPATRRPLKTIEDYLALPDDVRTELIDGEIHMAPAPCGRHQHPVLTLGSLLQAYVEAGAAGLVLVSPSLPGFEAPLTEIFEA